jgi:undecaprenyl-diphosphatase
MVCSQNLDIGFAGLSYIQVLWLGLLQGITELLPISSTAHMRIVPAFLGWPDPGSAFSAVMQLAALAAVVSYFRKDVAGVVEQARQSIASRNYNSPKFVLLVGICIATLPIGFAGITLSGVLNSCNSPLRGLTLIGIASLVMAALLGITEVRARHSRTLDKLRLRDALWVGIAQAAALIPGVSRSGATLTAGLWLDFTRADAARLSFLLGLPAITLAGLKEVWVLWKAQIGLDAWLHIVVGLGAGSLSAFLAIWTLMRFLERFSAWLFVLYRALLGVALITGVSMGYL